MLEEVAIMDGEKVIRDFKAMTKDAENVQRATLELVSEKMDALSICRNWASMAKLSLKVSRLVLLWEFPIENEMALQFIFGGKQTKTKGDLLVGTATTNIYRGLEKHYAGDVPLITVDYGATEGWIGVNVNPTLPPESTTYVVPPNIGYFEFIPLNKNVEDNVQDEVKSSFPSVDPKSIGLTEVKVGEEYEVIVSSVTSCCISNFLS
ncbi:hypothetical protein V6N11_015802 [Hibiscus sabdariffa]|uniref:GH3 middle domain-containing protein n=1 Tax=Hibiscus sabdariffa TaxID=183260 RepID=A0ABR2TT42_9ROSI